MKNLIKCITVALVMLFSNVSSFATTSRALPADSTKDAMIYSKIITRVSEIQGMDKTNLSASDKKDLRKELTTMKKQASGLNNRVYLSVGAIIIAILLLILILR